MTQQAGAASRYRVAVVTWLVVYPVITLLLFWALPAAHIRMRFFLQPDAGADE